MVREGREERADHRGLARPPPTVGFKVRGFQPAEDHDMAVTQEKPYREVLGLFLPYSQWCPQQLGSDESLPVKVTPWREVM